jgi:formylglycine-generating enzyme required for sulfatase activity
MGAGVRLALLIVLLFPLATRAEDHGAAPDMTPNEREFKECPECPRMIAVPSGSFVMGSPAKEAGRFDAEGPQRKVSIRAFALGKYDVTIEEFTIFLRETGYQPEPCDRYVGMSWSSPGKGLAYPPYVTLPPQWPAFCLNWDDTQAYLRWLNQKARAAGAKSKDTDGPYRLPTEAEWEYAARAGTTTSRWWGDAPAAGQANCNGCGSRWDGKDIAPVGSFGPNAFGLYDMLGNVWQWVADCWNDSYVGAPGDGHAWISGDCKRHVLRGGCWSNPPVFVRSAARIGGDARGADFDYSAYAGFRVARTLP